MTKRNILFIGHANPQDNEFSKWLYSRLIVEGYSPWVDLEGLRGGEEDFWEEIQERILQEFFLKFPLCWH